MSDTSPLNNTDKNNSDTTLDIKCSDNSKTPVIDSTDFIEPPINSPFQNILAKCDKFDKKLSNYIHEMEVNIWVEIIIYIFARIFNSDLIIAFYLLLFLYQSIFNQNYYFVIKPLIHVFVIFILTGILKYSLKRPRPEINENVKRKYNFRNKETNFSMPSGDSMQAANFAIICLFYLFGNYIGFIGFIIIPLVMFARIFYFCHYLFDTIVGAIVGLTVSYCLTIPLEKLQF
jgi:membrane-associated phospholipid phosphatase